jgi:hypothetical protein
MKTWSARIRFLLTFTFLSLLSIPLWSLGHKEMGNPIPIQRSEESFAVAGHPEKIGDHLIFNSEGSSFEVNLKNLSCLVIDMESKVATVISKAAFPSAEYRINEQLSEVSYPALGIWANIGFKAGSFALELSSQKPQTITWPSLSMEKESTSLIWPQYEGSYVPLNDTIWTDYLKSVKWNTTQSLYMPFWGVENGRQLISYIFENPFHNAISFAENEGAIQMDFTHTFPDNDDLYKPITFMVYLDHDASPITPARYFRQHLIDTNAFVTFQEKMKIAPVISRLIGAPHAYIWDGAPITMADVKADGWIPLAKAIVEQAAAEHSTAGKQIMRALFPEKGNIEAMSRQSTPSQYLQRGMANSLSKVLRSTKFYSGSVWPLETLPAQYGSIAEKIVDGENVPEYELVKLNGYLLHSSFPEYLNSPSTWGNGVSTRMIDAFAQNGMDRFVLTCNGVESIDIRPNVASYAAAKGYLIGPYDSYHEIQDPGAPEWSTAIFDRALYQTGGIIRADGTPVKGFHGVGYYVSPIAIKPYFDDRIAKNFLKVPFSYYFLDCDAFGEIFDDYHPGRIVSASEDVTARVDRVRSIFEKYKVPVGSEGGSYLFAGSLAVAEGVFFPGIGGDPDMEINEMSKYFLGRPFPADEPESYFLPALLKDKYVRLYGDPRFRLPLYEAVFHDSVITTSHYSSPSLKFTNIAETTALTEILYQVAPMYHFNLSYFEKIKETIEHHIDVFEKTHSYSYRYALEDFDYLNDERSVQRTRFGDLELIANFQEEDFAFTGTDIPARSVLITFTDSGESFVYNDPGLSYDENQAEDIPLLIRTLSSTEWEQREQAALAISLIGAPAKAGVPSLIMNLKDEEWRVRAAAAKALANMEGEAASAVPALMQTLKDEEWQVRRPAAYALAAIGKNAKAAIPKLIEALNDEEWHVRRPAALALGAIGADAWWAIPALEARLGDPELQVRMAVEMALKSVKEGRPYGWR